MGALSASTNREITFGSDPSHENLQNVAQSQSIFEHMQGAFSAMAEHIGDIIPRPPLTTTARLTAGLLAITGAGALASTAEAKIVVGQSIAGVNLGDTEAEVTQTLGTPTLQQPPDTKGGVEWNYANQPLMGAISFAANGDLTGMWTSSKQQKTNKKVGPGSSLAQVRKAYPKASCSTGPFGPESVVCTIKSHDDGRIVETSFPFFTRSMGAREVDINLE